ncbi:MAG: aspartate/glutamate racemase family protein, partial [Desulfurococcaceae archaeon]
VINPVSVDVWDDLVLKYAKTVLSSDVEVAVRHIPSAPPFIETEYEKELAAPLVVREVLKASEEGFKGVVINCFDDPGLEASREVSSIPVLGIGETSLMTAMLLGYNIAVISTGREWSTIYRRRASQLGVERRIVYISGIDVPILDLRKEIERVKALLVGEIKKAIRDYGADVAVLGCGGLIGLADELSETTGIPVIDPTITTLKIAEAIIKLKLKHRKVKSPLT